MIMTVGTWCQNKQIIIFVCVSTEITNIFTLTHAKILFVLGTRQAIENEIKTKTRTCLENIDSRARFV